MCTKFDHERDMPVKNGVNDLWKNSETTLHLEDDKRRYWEIQTLDRRTDKNADSKTDQTTMVQNGLMLGLFSFGVSE